MILHSRGEAMQENVGELPNAYAAEPGLLRRLALVFSGLRAPRNSLAYRKARRELPRLWAPLVAILIPVIAFVVLLVVTAIGAAEAEKIEIRVSKVDDKVEELAPEEPPPPPEELPQEDVLLADNIMPGPESEMVAPPAPVNMPKAITPAPVDAVAIVKSPVTMRSVFGSRTTGSRGVRAGGGGGHGDARTEDAVMKVLWWLKATQNSDGSWGRGKGMTANTAIAVLAYLAHGEFPGSDSPNVLEFGPVLERAVNFLISDVDLDHKSGVVKCRHGDIHEYSFLLAAYALAETFGCTHNPACREVAEPMLQRIIDGQSSTGGWNYNLLREPEQELPDDISYGGWAIQALKAGKMAKLRLNGLVPAIRKAIWCMRTRNASQANGFDYRPGYPNYHGLGGVGCLAMQLLGSGSEREALHALDVVRNWQPAFDPALLDPERNKPVGPNPQYYCYYITQCKFQAGMKEKARPEDQESWYRWNRQMKELYPSSIVDLPDPVIDARGVAHPQGYYENQDISQKSEGVRPYLDSCLTALQLMVYYRYLPTSTTEAGRDEIIAEPDAGEAIDAVTRGDSDVSVDI